MTTLQELAEKHCKDVIYDSDDDYYQLSIEQLEALIKEVIGEPVMFITPKGDETVLPGKGDTPLYAPQVKL